MLQVPITCGKCGAPSPARSRASQTRELGRQLGEWQLLTTGDMVMDCTPPPVAPPELGRAPVIQRRPGRKGSSAGPPLALPGRLI